MDQTMLSSNDESRIPYEQIMNYCMEAVFIYRVDGTIISCNETAKRELGYLGEQDNMVSIFPKELTLHNRCVTLIEGMDYDQEIDCFAYRKNLTCYAARVKITKAEENRYGICFIQNITKECSAKKKIAQMESELASATKVKHEFLANITHELRTPVNGMHGLADALLDTTLTREQAESVNIIIRCCSNMEQLINQLLDFSKLEAGKLVVDKIEFDFYKFIDETLALNLPKINEKGLRLLLNLGKHIPKTLVGDELRLGQVLNNLFSNAIKFTAKGQISFEVVNTYQSDTEVELFFMISDTGIGIAKKDMDKLFISFSQVDSSITRRFGGTGLGLAICKQIVEQMGGGIFVDSELGNGSTFSFSVRFGLKTIEINDDNEIEDVETKGRNKQDFSNAWSHNLKHYMDINASNQVEENQMKQVLEKLERLLLCIELGTWEKAEKFASEIKATLPATEELLKKESFRLELQIRKGNYEESLKQVRKLQELINS